ncbi:hypothetical protein MINTM008_34700 [Mycobacterium intracellulare]|nr:hypothetical protein MINTM002_31940 [Mycobacterium intracellulare]BCO63304.1 hypothetical protein MINTM006_32540 [Mycobacterium intracellulare]BCO68610.1 hypothetical protein MINTM007_32210 [Mycobacterium intracellulare]BCO74135.1 hypothetical protein MINTM008_34700 [Mycobacterium intracellulare]BCO79589.1 hypothetical protein MINTM009_33710 [Mycobacterium intracellulare]
MAEAEKPAQDAPPARSQPARLGPQHRRQFGIPRQVHVAMQGDVTTPQLMPRHQSRGQGFAAEERVGHDESVLSHTDTGSRS